MNLRKVKRIHFTGIKGVGMAALALCCQDLGKLVDGSDTEEVFPTDAVLKRRRIKVKTGFSPANLPRNCGLVIYTGAHGGANNPEVLAAKEKNIPVLAHAQALGLLSEKLKTIAVAGVGGKSTASAMLATVLASAGVNSGFAVGVGDIACLGTPGKMPAKAKFFVAEADEFVTDPGVNLTPRFYYLKPFLAIITNIEYDHPDVYRNLDEVYSSFKTFVKPVPPAGCVIANFDNPHVRHWLKTVTQPVISYGFSPQADWQIVKTHVAEAKQFIKIKHQGIVWPDLILNVPGEYNALNGLAALAAANFLGLNQQKIYSGLKKFSGSKRRFELIKTIKGISLYDDYAHHPTEIAAVLKAAKAWLPYRRLIAIFQSHTYSRTKALLTDFAKSFESAHQVIINDIFPSARETDNLGLTGATFANEVKKFHSHVAYCPDKSATVNYLSKNILKGDVIFTLGAGNNWLWHKDIIKLLKQR